MPELTPIQKVIVAVRGVVNAHSVSLNDEEQAMKRLEDALKAWEKDIIRKAYPTELLRF